MRGIILFTALIVCVGKHRALDPAVYSLTGNANILQGLTLTDLPFEAFAQPIVKIDWTQVNVQSGSLESVPTHVLPRAASFSDGRYIVVYTIRTANSDARVYGQIFNANGSVAVSEFDVDPDASDINVMSSPTVAVFPDDTYVIYHICIY